MALDELSDVVTGAFSTLSTILSSTTDLMTDNLIFLFVFGGFFFVAILSIIGLIGDYIYSLPPFAKRK